MWWIVWFIMWWIMANHGQQCLIPMASNDWYSHAEWWPSVVTVMATHSSLLGTPQYGISDSCSILKKLELSHEAFVTPPFSPCKKRGQSWSTNTEDTFWQRFPMKQISFQSEIIYTGTQPDTATATGYLSWWVDVSRWRIKNLWGQTTGSLPNKNCE